MKKVVVLTGAGMSAESGISTFRDSGGLWEKYPVADVATPEGYARDPQLVLDFYNARRRQLSSVKPCRGHELLAEMERDYDVTIITQNVDNLHERAGSSRVVHLHGELMKATSSVHPDNPDYVVTLPEEHPDIALGDLAADGSQLRPFIVWFGEAVPLIEEAIRMTQEADVFVVIGTSLNVYPAAGLLRYVPEGAPVYLIDPKPVSVSSSNRIVFIRESASEGVAHLMELLKIDNNKV